VSSLIDIAFPYRRRRSYGAASFAFTFLVLVFEVELLAFIGVAIAAVFWWRARSWSRQRVETLEAWARSGTTFGQQLAQKRD
jgi:hypothetical protein